MKTRNIRFDLQMRRSSYLNYLNWLGDIWTGNAIASPQTVGDAAIAIQNGLGQVQVVGYAPLMEGISEPVMRVVHAHERRRIYDLRISQSPVQRLIRSGERA